MGGSSSREACLQAYIERETQVMVDRHYYLNQVHQTVKILPLVPPIFTAFDENKDTWLQLTELYNLLSTYIEVLKKCAASVWKRTLCVRVDSVLAHMRKHYPHKYQRIAAAWKEDYQRMHDELQRLLIERQRFLNKDPLWMQIIAKQKGELEQYQAEYNKQFGIQVEKQESEQPDKLEDKHYMRLLRNKQKKAQQQNRAQASSMLLSQRNTSVNGLLSPRRVAPVLPMSPFGRRAPALASPTGLRSPTGLLSMPTKQVNGLLSGQGPRGQSRAFTFGNGTASGARRSSMASQVPLTRRGSSGADTPAFLRRSSLGGSSAAAAAAMLQRRASGDPSSHAAIAAAASLMNRRLSSERGGDAGKGRMGSGAGAPSLGRVASPVAGRKGSLPSNALLMSMMSKPHLANILMSQMGSRPTLYQVQQAKEPESPYAAMVPVKDGLLRRWLQLLKAGEPKSTVNYGQVDMTRCVSRTAFLEVFRIVLEKTDLSLAGITRRLFNRSRMGPVIGAYYRQAMHGATAVSRAERRQQIAAEKDRIAALQEERRAAEKMRERERARRMAKNSPPVGEGAATPAPGLGSPGRRVGSAGVGAAGLAKGSLKGGKVITTTLGADVTGGAALSPNLRTGTPAATRAGGRNATGRAAAYVTGEDEDSDEDLVVMTAQDRNRRMRARNKGRGEKKGDSSANASAVSGDFSASVDADEDDDRNSFSMSVVLPLPTVNSNEVTPDTTPVLSATSSPGDPEAFPGRSLKEMEPVAEEEEDDEDREEISLVSKPADNVTPGFTSPNARNWMNESSEEEEDEDEDYEE